MKTIYTIGYATKDISELIAQLQQYEVGVVADIRSVPYSAAFKDYHQKALQAHLKKAGIRYVYLGKELGPRSKEDSHYDESNQVQFDRLMQSDLFLSGIERLKNGLEGDHRIALLCAEKDPAICHRSLLVSHYLVRHLDTEVQHISHSGELESQKELEIRLIDLQELQADMLTGTDDLLELAYQQQLKDYAYKRR